MKCPHCHRELFEGDEIDGSWDREVDRKAANWELMRTIMAYKKAGLSIWAIFRVIAGMWDNTHVAMTEMTKERL